MDVTLDMGQTSQLNTVSVGFIQLISQGIYIPAYVKLSVSVDGINFTDRNNT